MLSLFQLSVLSFLFISVVANNGEATFYDPGLGACGTQNTSGDLIAAVAQEFFDSYPGATSNPNTNPICNKRITVNYQGRSVTVAITDRCPGCKGKYDLDLSPAAFDHLADRSVGRLHEAQWDFADEHRRRAEFIVKNTFTGRDVFSGRDARRMARRRRSEMHIRRMS
ncbi:Allergen Asp f 7 [Hypsizygus marmoreus]|uniref:Allergen Asp f 7 n=1 Tax=Hypsizygus marmoreus TaxID=39966 RepID=A0A369K3F5_HYPMA|nr:Allergen Asp f 7 [Hypsizygus marmoreus]